MTRTRIAYLLVLLAASACVAAARSAAATPAARPSSVPDRVLKYGDGGAAPKVDHGQAAAHLVRGLKRGPGAGPRFADGSATGAVRPAAAHSMRGAAVATRARTPFAPSLLYVLMSLQR